MDEAEQKDLNMPSSNEIKTRRKATLRSINRLRNNFLQVSQDEFFIKEFEAKLKSVLGVEAKLKRAQKFRMNIKSIQELEKKLEHRYQHVTYMLSLSRAVLVEPHKLGFRFMSSPNKRATIRGYTITKLPEYGEEFREYAQARLVKCLAILANNPRFTMNSKIYEQLLKIQKASVAIGLDKHAVKLLKDLLKIRSMLRQQYIQTQLKPIPSLFGHIKKALSTVLTYALKGIRSVFGSFSKAVDSTKPIEQAVPQAEKKLKIQKHVRFAEDTIKPAISKQAECPRQGANGAMVHSGTYSTATSLRLVSEKAKHGKRESVVVSPVK
jgi:ribosomal protein S8